MSTADSAFAEAFLQANANPDFIASEFSDVIRYILRAVAAEDSYGATSAAADKMRFCAELLERCEEPLSWFTLFSKAIDEIKYAIPSDSEDRRYISAAKRGTKYFVECSSMDGFAAARASKALESFRQSVRD